MVFLLLKNYTGQPAKYSSKSLAFLVAHGIHGIADDCTTILINVDDELYINQVLWGLTWLRWKQELTRLSQTLHATTTTFPQLFKIILLDPRGLSSVSRGGITWTNLWKKRFFYLLPYWTRAMAAERISAWLSTRISWSSIRFPYYKAQLFWNWSLWPAIAAVGTSGLRTIGWF